MAAQPPLCPRPLLASADVIRKRLRRQLLGEAGHLLRLFQPPTPLFRPRDNGPFLSPISDHSGGRAVQRRLCSSSRPVGWGQGRRAVGAGPGGEARRELCKWKGKERGGENEDRPLEPRGTPNTAQLAHGLPTPARDSERVVQCETTQPREGLPAPPCPPTPGDQSRDKTHGRGWAGQSCGAPSHPSQRPLARNQVPLQTH